MANENMPFDEWMEYHEQAKRYESNWQTRKAIKAFKQKRPKQKVQMSGLLPLDDCQGDEEDGPDSVLS